MAIAEDYVPVADRIVAFRDKYPEGTLQPFEPWRLVEVAGSTFIVYTAAAYRAPDDPRPGVGTAWEPCPGLTNFTRNSELQNAETSAWGRALIAVGAADAKKGVASAEDVRNRQAEQAEQAEVEESPYISPANVAAITKGAEAAGVAVADVVLLATDGATEDAQRLPKGLIPAARDARDALKAQDPDTLARLAQLRDASPRLATEDKAPQGASVGTAGPDLGDPSSGVGPRAEP